MKKLLSIPISLFLIIPLVLSASAHDLGVGPEEIIEDALIRYYYAKDVGTEYDFNEAMNSPIAAYLDEKTDTLRYSTQLYGLEKTGYSVEVSAMECNTKDSISSY